MSTARHRGVQEGETSPKKFSTVQWFKTAVVTTVEPASHMCVNTGPSFGDVRVVFSWYSGGTLRLHVEFSNHVMLLLWGVCMLDAQQLLLLRDALFVVVAKSRLCSRQPVKSVSHAS